MLKTFRLLAISTFLFPVLSWAGTPAVVSANGNVEVGRDAAWTLVKPGTAIKDSEFLRVPTGASVKVKLANGSEAEFLGKAVVPGRRLHDPKTDVDALMKFYKMYQKAATTVGGEEKKSSIAASGKACKAGEVVCRGECHKRVECLKWSGEGNASLDQSPADKILTDYLRGQIDEARFQANQIAKNPEASKADRRIAFWIVGAQQAELEKYQDALAALDIACAPLDDSETNYAKYRANALLERGKVLINIGSPERARKDLEEAAGLSGGDKDSAVAGEARFLLGYLAIEANDLKAADAHFKLIPNADEALAWQNAARDMKKAAGIH